MRAYQRFLKYATIHTTSDETTHAAPSTQRQLTLARLLVQELEEMGLQQVQLDPHGIVTAALPATPGCESVPVLGFLAHMDTAPDFSGENVQPILHENYDGGDIALPKDGRVIRVADFPFLKELAGKTVITADGSTLLGADDKAGIAEIITLCQRLSDEAIPHGPLRIAFTPDEEIGEGTAHFDVEAFGAQYAYTVDGGRAGTIEYENFNAASAAIDIAGVSVHPGSAKGIMENALLIAAEINAALPSGQIPAQTEGYQGFFHLTSLSGTPACAQISYLVRDHSDELFAQRKELLQTIVRQVQAAHPKAQLNLSLRDSYFNMASRLEDCMHLVENAKQAALDAGVAPGIDPIRGGTDGAQLSYKGLPCPNLGTGGFNFHGPCELIAAEDMDTVVEILKNIVVAYAGIK